MLRSSSAALSRSITSSSRQPIVQLLTSSRPIAFESARPWPASLHYSTASPTPSTSTQAPSFRPSPKNRYKRELPAARDLPNLRSRTPLYLGVALIAAVSWGTFLSYATNNERANSSVVRSLAFQLRSSPAVKAFLGDNVKMPAVIGEFRRVKGSINMLSGKIDVQFRVKGSEHGGTASFTSIRQGKEGRFEVLR